MWRIIEIDNKFLQHRVGEIGVIEELLEHRPLEFKGEHVVFTTMPVKSISFENENSRLYVKTIIATYTFERVEYND